jgi:hypothetical protein
MSVRPGEHAQKCQRWRLIDASTPCATGYWCFGGER